MSALVRPGDEAGQRRAPLHDGMNSEANPERFRQRPGVTRESHPGERWPRSEIVRAWRTSQAQSVPSDDGVGYAAEGDWIVMTEEGNLSTVPDKLFRRMYEPIEG